jgi:hypothetical protein
MTERSSCEDSLCSLQARILGTPHPSPCPSLPTLMSSVTTSSSNFSYILDAALDSYAKQTGIDLTKHPSADKLQNCRCPDDVLQILSERESALNDHRDRYRTLLDHVRPVVQVVHMFSDVLGEAAGFVSSGIAYSLSDPIFTPPNRFHFSQQKRYLSELIFSFRYISPSAFHEVLMRYPFTTGCNWCQCKL